MARLASSLYRLSTCCGGLVILLACVGCGHESGLAWQAAGSSVQPAPDGDAVAEDGFVFAGLEARADRRAFYTAPPVIPHRIGGSDRDCIACHQQERDFLGKRSMRSPHPEWVNCQQCHVRGASDVLVEIEGRVANDWQGLAEPHEGSRHHAYAPPTMPHRLFLREDCASCHSDSHPRSEQRVEHSERANCQQCHVPEAGAVEFQTRIGRP